MIEPLKYVLQPLHPPEFSSAWKVLFLFFGIMFSPPVFAGSAAAPNYTFSGNTNTGMFNPMANIVGFSTAGAERLRVDASGNVGIGTTLPGAMLEVAGQVKITGGTPGAGKVLTSDGVGLATWTAPSTGSVTSVSTGTGLSGGPVTTTGTISLANTTVAAGSFGTSTSIPTFNVDAQGRLTGVTAQAIPNATTTVTGLLTFGDWNIFNGKLNKAGDTMTGLLVLSADPAATLGAATKQYVDAAITTAGANYIRKDGTVAFTAAQSMGSFKINFVADPVSAQDAATKNYADTKILSKTATAPAVGQNGQSLKWNDGNTTWEYYTASAALGYTPVNRAGDTMTGALISTAGTAAAPSVGVGATTLGLFNGGTNILGFSTAGTERMRVDASGNVGIGTTTPSTALQVNGTVTASDFSTGSASLKVRSCEIHINGSGAAGVLLAADADFVNCVNKFGATATVTSVQCFSDNSGTTTMQIATNAPVNLLSSAVTCSPTGATGTLSGTPTILNNGWLTAPTLTADGTTKTLVIVIGLTL